MKLLLLLVAGTMTPTVAQVHGDTEFQIAQDGGNRYVSQILTEQIGKVFLLQRYFPAQGRMPRYELGAGRVFQLEFFGPCRSIRFQPYTGWASEGSGYLTTSGVISGTCGGRKTLIIVDRKNLIQGERSSFQYNRVAVGLYKFISFRWDGFYKDSRGLVASQPGLEAEAPFGKSKLRFFATVQYDLPSSKMIHHFGFRF